MSDLGTHLVLVLAGLITTYLLLVSEEDKG